MAVVLDGRCPRGLAGRPGDSTRLQTPSLSPASQGINKLIRPAAHMGRQSQAAARGLLEQLGLSHASLVMFRGDGLIAGEAALPVTFRSRFGH